MNQIEKYISTIEYIRDQEVLCKLDLLNHFKQIFGSETVDLTFTKEEITVSVYVCPTNCNALYVRVVMPIAAVKSNAPEEKYFRVELCFRGNEPHISKYIDDIDKALASAKAILKSLQFEKGE